MEDIPSSDLEEVKEIKDILESKVYLIPSCVCSC